MQIEEDFGTYLTGTGKRALVGADGTCSRVSPALDEFAKSLGLMSSTLVSLAAGASTGRWPGLIGGKLLILEKLALEDDQYLISFSEASERSVAELLSNISGDDLFILTNTGGRVFCLSEKAEELFTGTGTLISMFDSSSSGAISAALLRCAERKPLEEFLVSSSLKGGQRVNYGIRMRRLPAPGRLVLCRLSVPSVAVVTQSIDSSGLMKTLLEECFCPAFAVDASGTISSMNLEARKTARVLWGIDPSGRTFSELVHPVQRKAMEHRHLQRVKGYPAPSRYSVRLIPSRSGADVSADVSVIPVQDSSQWVIFAKLIHEDHSEEGNGNGYIMSSRLCSLLGSGNIQPKELLEGTVEMLGAESGAYLSEDGLLTVGDSRQLMERIHSSIPGEESANREGGFYHRPVCSCFTNSHLYFQGIDEKTMEKGGSELINIVGAVFCEYRSSIEMRKNRRILAMIRKLAAGFLEQREPTGGMLAELAGEAGAETAAVFSVSRDGASLKVADASGIVGETPEISLESMNTASWACLRGEEAFYSLSPGNDLRFSSVFPGSAFEMAAPFYSGTTPEGVILLATTDGKGLRPYAGEILQLIAVLLSTGGKTSSDDNQASDSSIAPLMSNSLERLIHTIAALEAASSADCETLTMFSAGFKEDKENLRQIRETVKKLGFYSRWAFWWLRMSLPGARPDQRWLNPVPLLEKALSDFAGISETALAELVFNAPDEDMEVCTDGVFLNMILYSILACILENTSKCTMVEVKVRAAEEHWTVSVNASGDSVPVECLSMQQHPEGFNLMFMLAWKLTESLGGTVNTFSNTGRFTNITVRMRTSG